MFVGYRLVSNQNSEAARLSIAPMMDWTDRHCRFFHRLICQQVLLYTEMITATSLVRGSALHLLDYSLEEHPVALQLGGCDPVELASAAKLGQELGYDEINFNVGCPSNRVQSGAFGAVLMKRPGLVAECCAAMLEAVDVEVTVKCRIGVDDQDVQKDLPKFLSSVSSVGVSRFIIHARKAWLNGLSPKENRNIPPLNYNLVYAMKNEFPALHLSLNGGIRSLQEAKAVLDAGLDGVMIGRAAYRYPFDILAGANEEIYGLKGRTTALNVVFQMLPYIENHLQSGGKLNQVTRHMLGLFNGREGARMWRRVLSECSHNSGGELVLEALSYVNRP